LASLFLSFVAVAVAVVVYVWLILDTTKAS
jgi:hypothetical protein